MPRDETLLIVDDEPGIRTVLSVSLSDSGYEVLTAGNGEEALAVFEERHPDIVITDIRMPGMDGVELLREIKRRRPDTEVIMITGHGDMELAIQSLKHDAADFVTKPINDDLLEASLKKVQEKLGLKRELAGYTDSLERLVEEKSARYRDLFNHVPCYITVQDRDLRIKERNDRFAADFGGETGSHCYAHYKNRDEPCEDCPVLATFRDGETHVAEDVVTSRDGEPVYLLINTVPMPGPDGEVEQVMEMATDITQIRKLQDRLTNLGLLLGSVSHGVKGMLTALDGGVYRLESALRKNDPERMSKAVDTVKDLASRIKGMVLDILYYAKSRDLNWDVVEVGELARQTAASVEDKARRQNVEFILDFAEDLGTIEADKSLLASALVNMLENAVDACSSDTSKKDHRIIYEVVPDSSDHVVFSVVDDGTGMDQETRTKLFTLFFSSKGKKGTGLGLFIANQVVEQHGGNITVNSTLNQGSCFDIRVPRTLPDEAKESGDGNEAESGE